MLLARSPLQPVVRALGIVVAFILGVGGVLWFVLALGGFDVSAAMRAWLSGAVGSPAAFASGTLVRATPLILTGLAVGFAFRGGVLNIGADGQFLAGAATATWIAQAAAGVPSLAGIPFAIAGGALAGSTAAAVPAWLRRRFGVLEVITTLMMNFVALYLVGWLVRGPLQESTGIYPQSAPMPSSFRLATISSGSRLHVGFFLAVGLAVAAWWVLQHTALGFRIRAVGANPRAAESAGGVNVPRVAFRVFLFSGALAGVAGATEVMGVTYALYENLSPGYGYTAIAVALLASLNPLVTIVSGIAMAALATGGAAMQREAGVPLTLVSMLEALIILALLTWTTVSKRRATSRALT